MSEINNKSNTDEEINVSDGILDNETVAGETESSYENNQKPHRLRSIIIEIAIYAALLFVCIYIVPTYVVQRTIVDGNSMENTLFDEENLIVNKLAYRFGEPDRFDIIVFYPYGKDVPEEYYVKRIIGLPGEKIQIIGEDIYVNDEILEENYGKYPITDPGIASEPIVLGEEEYFVLGDNRKVSEDSRFFGPVERENISGHVVFRIYPFDAFGTVE
ncbi:MAG: signal peptidase I [Lachnospiraceae bacterium]|nr:signal peptidase I [Lachnospiraceae bacterium]